MSKSITILIAEDEKTIREGIRKMGEEFFENNKNCTILEAHNGRDAFRKCISVEPDILITDIKMPGISGLSLIKRLSQENFRTHILVISGHQDYKYVRESMKSGTYDYLLKPIKKSQLWASLEYFSQNPGDTVSKNRSTMYAEQHLVEHFLEGNTSALDSKANHLKNQGINCDMSCDVFFIMNDLLDKNREFELYYEIQMFCEDYNDIAVIQGELNSWLAICIYKNSRPPDFVQALENHLTISGYTVEKRYALNKLSEIYKLNANLSNNFYDIKETENPPATTDTLMGQIAALVLNGDSAEILLTKVNELFDRYRLDLAESKQIRNDILALLYKLMAQSADMIEFAGKARLSGHDIAENIGHAQTLAGFRSIIKNDLLHFQTQIKARRLSAENATIDKAIDFIEKNFASDLQLASVANAVHLHPNYFSSYFRQKMGLTFRDYLRKVRIDCAKRLIEETHLTINEVAEQSGFKDLSHFFRVFKATTGITPKKYKKMIAAK